MFPVSGFNKETRIWRGPNTTETFNTNNSVGQILLQCLKRYPDKVVQICDELGTHITGKQMWLMSIRAAQNLLKLGINQRDVIGIVGRNSTYLAPIVYAGLSINAPINALDYSFGYDEIHNMFGQTKPKIVFCDEGVHELVMKVLIDLKIPETLLFVLNIEKDSGTMKSVQNLLKETGNEDRFMFPLIGDGSKEIAVIVCSSGTTGLPKGVCVSHAQILERYFFTNPENQDVFLGFSTLYWVSGWSMLLNGTFFNGTRIITTEPFSPEKMVHLIETYKVTTMMGPPSQLAMLVAYAENHKIDMSSFKYFLCGGSRLPDEIYKKAIKYFPPNVIDVGYGMSEIGVISCVETKKYSQATIGSVGFVADRTEVKIIDENGDAVQLNQKGEICIRSRYQFLGYYGREDLTKTILDDEGWVHSGDLGYLNGNGELFIYDRKKDIMKYRNFHVTPSELESVVESHPQVLEVCVVGIPDDISTDLPAAVITSKNGKEINKDEIMKLVSDRLSHFKQLRGGVYQVNALPKTVSGKIRRNECKEIAMKCYNECKPEFHLIK